MHIWSIFFMAGYNVHPVGRWAHCAQYDYPAFSGQLIEDSSAMNSSLERSVIGSEGGTAINRILATSPPPWGQNVPVDVSFLLCAFWCFGSRLGDAVAKKEGSELKNPLMPAPEPIRTCHFRLGEGISIDCSRSKELRSGPLFHPPALLYPELCELIGHLIPCRMPGDISFADQLSQGLLDPVSQVGESMNQDMLGQMSGLRHARLLAQFNENNSFEVGYHT